MRLPLENALLHPEISLYRHTMKSDRSHGEKHAAKRYRSFYGILIPMLDWTKELKDVKAELKAASKDKSRPHSEGNDVLTII